MNAVDFNPQLVFDKLDAWADGLFKLLPNIAIVVLPLFWLIGLGISNDLPLIKWTPGYAT